MKKGLVILFAVFLIAILLSLFLTGQGQKAVSVSEKEAAAIEPPQAPIPSNYSVPPVVARQPVINLHPVSGITIVENLLAESGKRTKNAPEITQKASNTILNPPESSSEVETPPAPQTGITETVERPPVKAGKEPNSSGISLY